MALTYTPEVTLGMDMPTFQLKSTTGETIDSTALTSQSLLVMFICNHCPYVQAIEDRLIQLGQSFLKKDISILAICSNDPTDYPEDSFENLKKRAEEKNYPFPYLFDETQEVAKKFGAVCTPDFFLFTKKEQNYKLFYRGRLDDNWKSPDKVQKQELAEAIELSLNQSSAPKTQRPSMGCSIKWID